MRRWIVVATLASVAAIGLQAPAYAVKVGGGTTQQGAQGGEGAQQGGEGSQQGGSGSGDDGGGSGSGDDGDGGAGFDPADSGEGNAATEVPWAYVPTEIWDLCIAELKAKDLTRVLLVDKLRRECASKLSFWTSNCVMLSDHGLTNLGELSPGLKTIADTESARRAEAKREEENRQRVYYGRRHWKEQCTGYSYMEDSIGQRGLL